ncbi:YhdP family protein [Paludibacterium paludis]|uniref:DUF3971 domain-containing protein n=1 Tax=Paludibacterium paludis TaxID=1225769 RepID=A0A918P5V0_9NEIS|nr:YhdP family protein [Paludibacterium paludis]GGY23203.1 DUF3971 domain-containing protein [Paludibacterium paludis]
MEKHPERVPDWRVIATLRRLVKTLAVAGGLAALLISLAFAVFTWWFLPRLDDYRPGLAAQISRAVGRPVSIRDLSGQWEGVAPRLTLNRVSITDPMGGQALTLARVDIKPSWMSLVRFEPQLALIEIAGPSLEVRRTRADALMLNGFPLTQGKSDGRLGNWLLRQPRILVRGARIDWQDDYLGLPPLGIAQGELELTSGLLGHRLRVAGQPVFSPGTTAELTARWSGDDLHQWRTWSGSVSARLSGARVGAWNRYLSAFGLLRSGEGDGTLSASFSEGRLDSLEADVRVKNAAWRIPDGKELVFPELGGRLSLQRQGERYRIHASDLTLASQTGLAFNHTGIEGQWQGGAQGFGELTLDNADLHHLTPFIHALGADNNPLFARFSPSGTVAALKVSWKGPLTAPTHYALQSRFSDLAWAPVDTLPGVAGVSGSVRFDENGGQLIVAGSKARIDMPRVFPEALGFEVFDSDVVWKREQSGVGITIRTARFANADLKGSLKGSYRYAGTGAGTADLTASLTGLPANRVVHYLPYAAGQDTRAWLGKALGAGRLNNVSMVLRGDMDAFPFKGGKGGEFLVKGDVEKASLLFETGWPTLDGIDTALVFHNERMEVLPRTVSTLGVPLSGVKVILPDLTADNAWLDITGRADAPLAKMLTYTTRSPVDKWLSGFTGQIRASGDATLALELKVPLSGPDTTRVRGRIGFVGNRLEMTRLPLPPLDTVRGPLIFTEKGVESPGLAVSAFGGNFALTAKTARAGRMEFALDGEAPTGTILSRYADFLVPHVSGKSRFAARFAVTHGLESLLVTSDLAGTAITAPAPVGKEAAAALPLSLELRPETAGMGLRFTLGGRAAGHLRLADDGSLKAGAVAVGRPVPASLPDGLQILVSAPKLDLAPWVGVVRGGRGVSTTEWPLTVSIDSPLVTLGRYRFDKVSAEVRHLPGGDDWQARLRSAQISGHLSYLAQGGGQLRARLPRFDLNGLAPRGETEPSAQGGGMDAFELPAMDVRVDELLLDGNPVGSLDLAARRQGDDWLLDKVLLKAAYGTLSGSARVQGGGGPSPRAVHSRLQLDAADIGKMLDRFGVRDSFRKGQGRLSGDLSWPGGLADFQLEKVSGQVSMDLKDGRFAKVDPGVARLLGVLSLQSLTRRFRLDFTDVFSDGFAFDTLKGDARVTAGVFRSDNTQMKGPAADVAIRGQVNLVNETQSISLHVEPHLAESVALATGAALINPVVGVAALAAQKVLKDPVGRIFSVDYEVTGTLRDPVVSKKTANQEKRSPQP